MPDRRGRPWARLSDLRDGCLVELDSGFDCHPSGKVVVESNSFGLYFHCDVGHHYLYLETNAEGDCVGVYGPLKTIGGLRGGA
jgi:hypothetical protein